MYFENMFVQCTVKNHLLLFFLSVSRLPNFIYNDMEIEYLHEGNR